MTKRHPDDPQPTWFRLSPESWAMIRAEYLNGATARVLAKKYRVSPTSIYRHACQEGWTKEKMAEAVSRKSVADAERATQSEAAAAQRREAEMNALVEQIASEEDVSGIAAALERRALAQASVAMVQGRSKEAQALASMAEMMRKRTMVVAPPMTPLVVQREAAMVSPAELERRAIAQAGEALSRGDASEARALMAVAEQMRKRAEEEKASAVAAEEVAEQTAEQEEQIVLQIFKLAAHVASAMAHDPNTAPAVFLELIKRWREINLGEGEADAEKRAAVIAAALAHHIEGRPHENMPEELRAHMVAEWEETRARLEAGAPLGVVRRFSVVRTDEGGSDVDG